MNQSQTQTLGIIAVTAVAITSVIFFALPQVTRADETTNTVTATRKARVDATCMSAGVETRETALGDAWEAYTSSISGAITTRKTALMSAWGLSDLKAQKAAISTAWKAWKNASSNAHKELKTDKKSAWDAFKKTAKESCKLSTPKEETLGKDSSGTIAL